MSDRPNIPVPDELAAIREQLKALESREQVLRGLLLDNPDLRTGARFLVEIREVESRRTDLKELRAMYPAIADEHTHTIKTKRIELRGISDDGEVISTRQLAKIGSEQ